MHCSKFSFAPFVANPPRACRSQDGAARLVLGIALALSAIPVSAQGDAREALLQQIRALRAEQAEMAEMQRRTDARIRALETQVGLAPAPESAAVATTTVAAPPPPMPAQPAQTAEPRLKLSGDLRLRAQQDSSDDDGADRTSTQLRARIGATYAISNRLRIGGRLVTGDSDDPNSTDVQLSNWDDDLGVALDLAYAQLDFDALTLYGGKIPQPFARTDLVWDSDVNPQGAAAVYRKPLAGGGALRANGLYFTIDEQVAGPESNMAGLQFGFDSANRGGWKYELSGGYYRYDLDSLAGADSGDWRSNRRDAAGNFVSDFELLDLIGALTWQGRNERWPLRIVGDYVRNLGAVDDQDSGYGVDISLGRASKPGDWRFTYGYAQTDVDAVMAAFSHDNIGIATNYDLHALTVDYTPLPKTVISAIWYHYKPHDARFAGTQDADDWLDRFRLLFLMNF